VGWAAGSTVVLAAGGTTMRLVAAGSAAGLAAGGSGIGLAGGWVMRRVAGGSAAGGSTTGLAAGGSTTVLAAGASTADLVAVASSIPGLGWAPGGTHAPPVGLGPRLKGPARWGSRGAGLDGAGGVPAVLEVGGPPHPDPPPPGGRELGGTGAGFGPVTGGTQGPPIALAAGFLAWTGRSGLASGLASSSAPGVARSFSSARAGALSTFGSTFVAGGTDRAPADCRMGFPRRRGLPQDLQAVSRSPLCQPQLLQTITSSVR
jgi:hypothetical protein